MVDGLAIFREHFRDFSDRYILIGGTACDLAMTEAGIVFRATKDLDIVLCIEKFDKAFAMAFWEFIRNGKYRLGEKEPGKKQYYRFQNPEDVNFPVMPGVCWRTGLVTADRCLRAGQGVAEEKVVSALH